MTKAGVWLAVRYTRVGPPWMNYARFFPGYASWLDWMRAHWHCGLMSGSELDEFLGVSLGRFPLFATMGYATEEGESPPESPQDAIALYGEYHGDLDGLAADAHSFRVVTNDDEESFSYFLFDEKVAVEHRDRVAFLLHPDTKLPDTFASTPDFEVDSEIDLQEIDLGDRSAGTTYVVPFHGESDVAVPSPHCEGPQSYRIHGVRLPGILEAMQDPEGTRALGGVSRLCEVFMDAVKEGSAPPQSIVDAGGHHFAYHANAEDRDHAWFVFDDLWATENADLADSMLWLRSCWDPLSGRSSEPPRPLRPDSQVQ